MSVTTTALLSATPKPHGYLGATAAHIASSHAANDFMAVVILLAIVVAVVTAVRAPGRSRRRREERSGSRDYDYARRD